MRAGVPSEWFSAAELAELALPGMPATRQKVGALAFEDGWHAQCDTDGNPLVRRRAGRGGGHEYHLSLLPIGARQTLLLRMQAANEQDAGPGAVAGAALPELSAKAQANARERLLKVREVAALIERGSTTTLAVASVAQRWGDSARTIFRYLEKAGPLNALGAVELTDLAPTHGGGRVQADIHPTAWQIIKADYLRLEKPGWEACYRRLVDDHCAPRGLAVPSSKTLKRKLHREVPKAVIKAMRYGKEASRRMIPAQRRTVADLHALYAINIDGHTFDVFVNWGDDADGKPIIKRPTLIGTQDIYSRKLLSHRIDRTEDTKLARLVFADLFRDYGIPVKGVLDNGRAFASKALTGGAKTRFRFKINDGDFNGVLTQLGMDTHWTLPYRGSSKPIERAWKDLCEEIAKHPLVAGAYTGNKPGAKPENYGSRAIPIDEFRALVADRIRAHNARPGRDTEVCQGKLSFDQAFERSYATAPIRKALPEEIGMAMMEAKACRVGADDSVISLFGNRYWTFDLQEIGGEMVTVRFDPDNLHSEIHVFSMAGDFLCVAPVYETTGFFSKDGAVRRKKLEAEHRRKTRDAIEAQNLLTMSELAEVYRPDSDRVPDALPEPKVIRPARRRGQTAAALKPASEAMQRPAENDFLDNFIAGQSRHLRVVD